MTDTPTDLTDRIFAWLFMESERNEVMQGGWDNKPYHRATEYVPASELAARDAIIADLVEALNDTLAMPKGSIPESADRFYDGTIGRFTLSRAKEARHE